MRRFNSFANTMPHNLIVDPRESGKRLDKFLVRHVKGFSRSALQKYIASGMVTVNSTPTTAHRMLKAGDRVDVADPAIELQSEPLRPPGPEPTVVYEDQDVLVIDKPSGLTVHPGETTKGPTLVDWLIQRIPTIAAVGDDPELRPGIVHRLDRDVSGLMVVAKTQRAFDHLKRQFMDRTVTKEYLALVYGLPRSPHGTIDLPIERSRRLHGRMAAKPGSEEGREARTHYEMVRQVKNTALLRVTIETGRTHQIRVHLKALGHPIVGDTLYTTKPFRHKHQPLDRPFLHAAKLSFTGLDGTAHTFESPLPESLRRLIPA